MDEKYLYAKIQVLVPADSGSNAADQIENLFAGTDIEWDYAYNNSFAYNHTEAYAIYENDGLAASHELMQDGSVTLDWKREYTMGLYLVRDNRQVKRFTANTLEEVEAMVIHHAMYNGLTLLFPQEKARDE